MGKLAEAYVDIEPNLSPLDSGLDRAHSRIESFVGLSNKTLATLGVGISFGAITAGLIDAAKAAADFGESVSKTKTVFGGSFQAIADTVDDLAEKYGLVKQESLDAAANIGLVTQASGMSKSASAQLSSQLVRLAADAASFYNVPMVEALEKIRSALVGESEPIRSFGVLLSEDAVKAEALSLGLIKTTKSMTEQAKVGARASLVIKGMATASGDLERTADSTANQLRKMQGEIENFKVDFGKSLTGPLAEGIKLAREFGETLHQATGGMKGESLGDFIGGTLGGLRGVNQAGLETAASASQQSHLFSSLFGAVGYVAGAAREALFPSQERADRLAGVNSGGPAAAAAGPNAVQINEARRQAQLRARADEAAAAARDQREAPARRLLAGLSVQAGDFRGSAAGQLAGSLLQATMARGLLRGGAGLLAEIAPEEAKKSRKGRRSLSESAGVTSLDEAQRLTQTAALQRDPKLDEAKETNKHLTEANKHLEEQKKLFQEVARKLGLGLAAVVKGRS